MNASRAEARIPDAALPAIDGRYEPVAVVARNDVAIRMTAIDHGATTGASRVWLTLPAPSLARRQRDALRERFRRLAQLIHPNIPAYRCRSSAGSAYCVSNSVDGEPLSDIVALLAPDVLEKAEIDRIVRAVGSALAAAHDVGISHGALGQDCVIVTPDLDIRLTGFDLGDGRPAFDPAADIAALARMAAELHADPLPRERWPVDPGRPSRRRRRSSPLRLALLAALMLSILAVDPADVARLLRGLPGRPAADTPPDPAAAADPLQEPSAGTGAPIDRADVADALADPAATAGVAGAAATGASDAQGAITPPGQAPERAPRESPDAAAAVAATTIDGRELRFVPQVSRLAVGESDAMARLSLRTASGRSADIIWWLADGAARREQDYVDLGLQPATIPADSAIDIVVPLVADAIHEGDEDFEIYASNVEEGKQVGVPVSVRIRILDDD